MRYRLFMSVLAAFAATSIGAFAQTIEATPVPKPAKPNFASMQFLVGSWTCSTKSSRRPAAYETNLTYEIDPSGYWLIGKSTTKAVKWYPYEVTGEDRITYDANTARWVDVFTGDLGMYDLTAAKGWTASKIVWNDLAFAKGKDIASLTPLTWTRVSSTRLTQASGFTTVKGKTVTVATICKKQS